MEYFSGRYRNERSGQSLIELLVAMGVSVVVFAAALQLFAVSFSINTRGKDIQSATTIAQETLYAIRMVAEHNWWDIARLNRDDGSGTTMYHLDAVGAPQEGETSIVRNGKSFTIYFTIENVERVVDDSEPPHVVADPSTLKISVFVSWRIGGGRVMATQYITSHQVQTLLETWPSATISHLQDSTVTSMNGYLWSGWESGGTHTCNVLGVLRLANEDGCGTGSYFESGFVMSEEINFHSAQNSDGIGFLHVVWIGNRPDDSRLSLSVLPEGGDWIFLADLVTPLVPIGIGQNIDTSTFRLRVDFESSSDGAATPSLSGIILYWVNGHVPERLDDGMNGFHSIYIPFPSS